MKDDTPQIPVTQEVQQPETRSVSQIPQQSPVAPQTPIEPTPPTKPKKLLMLKILIISIVLISLAVGGFFVYKNFFAPKGKEVHIYKGIWTPTLLLQDENYLASNAQKLKDLGIDTVFILVPPPQYEEWLEKARESLPSELLERLEEVLPAHKEIIINSIADAHRNGLKVGLKMVFIWKPSFGMDMDTKLINSKIIEYAKLAEEYNVELFAPGGKPEEILGENIGEWRQEIISKVKKVYHGHIVWKGPGVGLPEGELNDEFFREIAEQPPGDYVGFDYIGFSPLMSPEVQTLEEYSQYVELALKYTLAQAERDGCKGVIITEFGVLDGMHLSEEESARAHEIVLEKAKDYDKVFGFFANSDFLGAEVPGWYLEENLKTQEVIKTYFTEILPEKKSVVY